MFVPPRKAFLEKVFLYFRRGEDGMGDGRWGGGGAGGAGALPNLKHTCVNSG